MHVGLDLDDTSFVRKSNPIASSAMLLYVLLEPRVLFWRPWSLLHIGLITTRSSSHFPLSLMIKIQKSHFLNETGWVVSLIIRREWGWF